MLSSFFVFFVLSSTLPDCLSLQLPPGSPCSGPGDCLPGAFTNVRYCCGGPPNGKYCSECCGDSDCSDVKYLCVPKNWLDKDPLYRHVRICEKRFGNKYCFRDEQCKSGQCYKGLGYSGDTVHYPLGSCTVPTWLGCCIVFDNILYSIEMKFGLFKWHK